MSFNKAFVSFTPEEQDLLSRVWPAESFRDTALEQYGADWLHHVPSDINALCYYWFGLALLPWQLAIYYLPNGIKEGVVHGGRGSGKSVGIAVAMAMYAALHPGNDWLHLAPVKDQAKVTYDAILRLGAAEGSRPKFVERFVESYVSAPFPEITLKKWADGDPGTRIRFRGLGDDDVERLRSLEAGIVTVDEAFRTVTSDATYGQLRGCIRGPNRFRLSQLPPAERDKLAFRSYDMAMTVDPDEKAEKEAKLEADQARWGIQKRGLMLLYGNAGPHEWAWTRHDRGYSQPERYFSYTATSYDNPYWGRDNLKALEDSFEDDPELREIEMLARRPRNLGSIFVSRNVTQCTNYALLPEAVRKMRDGEDGWEVRTFADVGVYLYRRPPKKDKNGNPHLHVFGADPGTACIPGRNKFCIMAFDVSAQPCELVYFEMGYTDRRSRGDFRGFWDRLRYASQLYPSAQGDIWIESSGNQKGMTQLAWPENLPVTAVELTAGKPVLINQAVQLTAHHLWEWPEIDKLLIETGNYDLPDKDLVQDIVMALICAAGGVWRYYGLEWVTPDQTGDPIGVELVRNARPIPRSGVWRGRRR